MHSVSTHGISAAGSAFGSVGGKDEPVVVVVDILFVAARLKRSGRSADKIMNYNDEAGSSASSLFFSRSLTRSLTLYLFVG
jgi:hypothetical protein